MKRSSDVEVKIEQIETHFTLAIEQCVNPFHRETPAVQLMKEAVLYSLNAGGKRIRPTLVYEMAHAYGADLDCAEPFAIAIEMIHTYSLIHDDLPCMDDDDLRRGKPTNHIVYGEDIATLAGDALLNCAAELMTNACMAHLNPIRPLCAMREILNGSGASGMILGQVADIKYHEHMSFYSKDEALVALDYINEHKTGKLLTAALLAGAYLGNASDEEIEKLREIGKNIGYLFQIVDDLLDVVGDVQKIGKRTQIDEKNSKLTYPAILGVEDTQVVIESIRNKLMIQIEELSIEPTFLNGLIQFLAEREY